MNKELKLVMMGASQSGKTCYMLAMYAVMSSSLRGFTFTTQDMDEDLELTNSYEEMLKGIPPPPTLNSKDWLFDCSYAFRKIMGFTWYDYRGEVLRGTSDLDDVKQFRERVREASCVILCVPGDKLADYVDGGSLPEGIRQFNIQMTKLYEEQRKTVPIVIAITKADLSRGKLEAGIQLLTEGPLSALMANDSDGGWEVMFCPVSLGTDMPKEIGPEAVGKINPVNVHIPVTYAIFTRLVSDIEGEADRIQQLSSKQVEVFKEKERLKDSWFNGALRGGNTRETEQLAREIQKELDLTDEKARSLQNSLDKIRDELMSSELYIYRNGKRVEPSKPGRTS